mgnify:CR=1 FL=1
MLCTCSPEPKESDLPELTVANPEEVISRRSRNRQINPPISSRWDFPPDIILCHGVPVTKERVTEAVDFWKRLGYEFGDIRALSQFENCRSMWGNITFRLPTGSELSAAINAEHLATTRYSVPVDMPDVLVMAEVYFQTTDVSKLPRVVEHELGHSLGWGHVSIAGHIMHPIYRRSGWSSEGVTHEDYRSAELKSRK